ncbi:hypothetical protein GN316_14555 [Xylophilus sp. Kf1]|nr:hypothetical protein [Xylophilus sp. Kf1]
MKPNTAPAVVWTTLSRLRAQAAAGECVLDAPVIAVMPWLRRAAVKRAADLMVSRAGVPAGVLAVLAVQDDVAAGPVEIWNTAMRHTRGAFFIYCAEDAFAGRYWLRFALEAFQQKPDAGLLAFNDGKWFGQLAAFGMVRRSWLMPLYGGALFHPGYAQHYGDTELTLVAQQQKALAYHPHALLVEVDHAKDKKAVNAADRSSFESRARLGFDGRVSDAALVSAFH